MKAKWVIISSVCTTLAIVFLLTSNSYFLKEEAKRREHDFQQKYDSLEQQLRSTRLERDSLLNSYRILDRHDKDISRSVDSLTVELKKKTNRYKNKTDRELENLLEERAKN